MNPAQNELFKKIETLYGQRYLLLKSYPVLSVAALQYLEKGDLDGFTQKLSERDLLAKQVDPLTDEINALISQLDEANRDLIQEMLKPSANNTACTGWYAGLFREIVQTQKLLRNCATLNTKMAARARAVNLEITDHLNKVRMQRIVRSKYTAPGANASGAYINYKK